MSCERATRLMQSLQRVFLRSFPTKQGVDVGDEVRYLYLDISRDIFLATLQALEVS